VERLDPADPASAARVNRWVSDHTRGKIPRIVDDLRGLVALLLDAIYFYGRWQQPFDPRRTRERPFHRPAAEPASIPMMARPGRFPYQEHDAFTAVGLTYGQGEVAMFLFLPRAGVALGTTLRSPVDLRWERVAEGFVPREGEVVIPRLRLAADRKLNAGHAHLGMVDAFSPARADFGGLSPTLGLYVQEVIHRAVLEVDEQGTEAAAVTSVAIRAMAMLPSPRFQFVADRPFAFAIADRRSQAVLFAGIVTDPRSP
jgi:serpin B